MSSTTTLQNGKLMPNLDQNTTKMLNLTVLQRMDPYIEEILITAAHVTLYEFNVDLNQWSRKDVEGSLFVVKRNSQPRFQFIVMNRRNTENLVENLLGDFEYEIQEPYLLYRNAAQEVTGVWFYNARECQEVANLFSRILGAYSKVPPKPQMNSTKSEFEELEAVPTSAVIEGPLEPAYTTSVSSDVPEDPAFINFFSTATNLGQNPASTMSSMQPYYSSVPNVPSPLAHSAAPSPAATSQVPSLPLTASSIPTMSHNDATEPASNSARAANLVKPSSFFTPASSPALLTLPISSTNTATSLQPPLNLQRHHGAPILQPFPPPTPPPSLTASNYGPLTKAKVRDALMMLVQDEQFIEMFYQAMVKSHQ